MARQISLLVVDDEKSVRKSLFHWFSQDGYAVQCAQNAREALQMIDQQNFDIVLADIKMPGMDGLEMNRRIKTKNANTVVIIMTAFASVQTALQALKDGANDYITKPFDPEDLSHLIRDISNNILFDNDKTSCKTGHINLEAVEDIIGESPAIFKIFKQIEKLAGKSVPVMITGEEGSGKKLVARAIHHNGMQKYFPMIVVHCGALAENSTRSELFGHEKGAFEGALASRKGQFELVNGGTLVLDEIASLSPKLQLDLLQVIESKTYSPVGSDKILKADFRLICTSKHNLKTLVIKQAFREDLYYRLNIATIYIPPLRERKEDIALLTDYFVKEYCKALNRPHVEIDSEAMQELNTYDYPGNIREMENLIERAILLCDNNKITHCDLPFGKNYQKNDFDSLREVEKKHILKVLEANQWNISLSARILEVDRVTLYSKINKHGLEREVD